MNLCVTHKSECTCGNIENINVLHNLMCVYNFILIYNKKIMLLIYG